MNHHFDRRKKERNFIHWIKLVNYPKVGEPSNRSPKRTKIDWVLIRCDGDFGGPLKIQWDVPLIVTTKQKSLGLGKF